MGCVEYKRQVHQANPARLRSLATQMSYRLDQGNGSCVYRLGVEDDGCHSLLSYEEVAQSATILECLVARTLNAVVTQRLIIQNEVVVDVLPHSGQMATKAADARPTDSVRRRRLGSDQDGDDKGQSPPQEHPHQQREETVIHARRVQNESQEDKRRNGPVLHILESAVLGDANGNVADVSPDAQSLRDPRNKHKITRSNLHIQRIETHLLPAVSAEQLLQLGCAMGVANGASPDGKASPSPRRPTKGTTSNHDTISEGAASASASAATLVSPNNPVSAAATDKSRTRNSSDSTESKVCDAPASAATNEELRLANECGTLGRTAGNTRGNHVQTGGVQQEAQPSSHGHRTPSPKPAPVLVPTERNTIGETLSARNIRVAVVGNVDAGKSTLIGTLTTSGLDDGRGRSRTAIMKHRHEIESGRTSTATTHLMGFKSTGQPIIGRDQLRANKRKSEDEVARESYRVVTLMDLAGHEKYLKTTCV